MDALDKVLAAEEELAPSSGFLASVMDRVHEEAVAPPPIPFPWKRFLPGLILAVAVLGWAAFELAGSISATSAKISVPDLHIPAAVSAHLSQAGWIALAAALSLCSWLFTRRLSGRRGLL